MALMIGLESLKKPGEATNEGAVSVAVGAPGLKRSSSEVEARHYEIGPESRKTA